MATINPGQDYGVILTLDFSKTGGTFNFTYVGGGLDGYWYTITGGYIYVRDGTSGAWSSKAITQEDEPINITSTIMQVGIPTATHTMSGQDILVTPSISDCDDLLKIKISQRDYYKDSLSHKYDYFYAFFSFQNKNIVELDVPLVKISDLNSFAFYSFAEGNESLLNMDWGDLSSVEIVTDSFFEDALNGCTNLESTTVPYTGNITSFGDDFFSGFTYECEKLKELDAIVLHPSITSVGDGFLAWWTYHNYDLERLEMVDTSRLTHVGDSFLYVYSIGNTKLKKQHAPDLSSLVSYGSNFMTNIFRDCDSLERLYFSNANWYQYNNTNFGILQNRRGILKAIVREQDKATFDTLTTSGSTLYTNQIRDPKDVVVLRGTSNGKKLLKQENGRAINFW